MRMSWGMINDAFSDIERGDMNNAVLNARLASNEALKALVFHKRVYEREKWHYLTVKRRSMLKREYLQLFESIHGLQTASKLLRRLCERQSSLSKLSTQLGRSSLVP